MVRRVGGWCSRTATAVLALALAWQAVMPASAAELAASPASLRAAELSGGVFYGRLGETGIYSLVDEGGRTACIILCNPPEKVHERSAFASLTERFQRAYGLKDYRISYAVDGSAAFLLREAVPPREELSRFEAEAVAMLAGNSLPQLVAWLNCGFGNPPQRLEGSRLVWRGETSLPGQEAAVPAEISLDLLRGVPACLELSAVGIKTAQHPQLLEALLGLRLEAIPRSKFNGIRRVVGRNPLACKEGKILVGGKRRSVGICLVEKGGASSAGLLASMECLKKLRSRGGEAAEATPPKVPSARWPEVVTPAPAPPPTAEEPPKPAPPAMPTPEEARRAYSQRLRAL